MTQRNGTAYRITVVVPTRAVVLAAVLAALLAIGLGIAGLVSADGGDADVMHACVSNNSGLVRIVGPVDGCRTDESARHWPASIPADPGVTGIRVFAVISASNSDNTKSAFVSCPDGTKAISGGGQVDAGVGDADNVVALHGTRPDDIPFIGGGEFGPPSGWAAFAGEVAPYAGDWSVNVWVVCADAP